MGPPHLYTHALACWKRAHAQYSRSRFGANMQAMQALCKRAKGVLVWVPPTSTRMRLACWKRAHAHQKQVLG